MASIKISQISFSREINAGLKRIKKPIFENINLEINHGEKVGLVGRNGAGKTTLLRLMAGIFEPDSGTIEITGQVNTVLDSGFGLEQALTGRENAYSWAVLRGMKRCDAEDSLQKIEEFSELSDSFDHPVKTYSSGMLMRLVLSSELMLNPGGVLLIDEGFGAADASFQVKAQIEIEKLLDAASLLVLTSHSDELLRKFCSRGIVLGFNQILFDGAINDAIDYYHHLNVVL
jgi:ABC-type polysaccharide/polyol phosphate transport system ATPase subunit